MLKYELRFTKYEFTGLKSRASMVVLWQGWGGGSTFIFIRQQEVRFTKYDLRVEIEAGFARVYENIRCFVVWWLV